MNSNFFKILRFIKIYGLPRTYTKVAGRMRFRPLPSISFRKKNPDISVVGCGQFAFSTISYFLKQQFGRRFLSAYDINNQHARSLGKFYSYKYIENSFDDVLKRQPKYLYIASNHYSHTDYAVSALKQGINVYLEKPISVNRDQFVRLRQAIEKANGNIYSGYNRPFSKAIIDLAKRINNKKSPLSINYYISGHKIEENHWYRDPKEGTRICGNVGHWLDLSIHLFALRGVMPERISITICYSDKKEPDDNISITLTTDFNDIVTIMLSSRVEPFEGINETINVQCDDVIAKIDDFRSLTVWQNEKLTKKKYWPKDVGHKRAILQPFGKSGIVRDWHEVELSTTLMLFIKDLVINRETSGQINLIESIEELSN